jgi:hypothetical protein
MYETDGGRESSKYVFIDKPRLLTVRLYLYAYIIIHRFFGSKPMKL